MPFGLAPPGVDRGPGIRPRLPRAPGVPAVAWGSVRARASSWVRWSGLPLDRQRPLWEMYLVEGLEGGLQAIVVKMHHAAIDGVSGAELAAAWLDLEADPPPEVGETDDWQPERVPSEIDLLVGAWASSPPVLPKRRGRPGVARRRRCVSQSTTASPEALPPPSPFSAPRTSFNLAITPHRRVCFGEVALEDLKTVKNHFGCTVNDVVLALCAGALRRYLLARGELPAEPLIALVPMSVRAEEDRLSGGNRLSAMLTSLATEIADPIERLRTISAAMSEAKSQESLIGADVLTDWTEFTLPALIGGAARLISSMRLFDHVRPAFNVTISNIPGPPFPLFLAGARVAGIYPLGPVVEGAGLNMTVMSYCDTVYFGLNGCRTTVPGIAELPAMITESLDELLAVVRPGDGRHRRSSLRSGPAGPAGSDQAGSRQPAVVRILWRLGKIRQHADVAQW